MAQYRFRIPKDASPNRLDVSVHAQLPDLSRRKIRRIIDVGGVYLNGKRVRIASREVQPGDQLVVEYDPQVLQQLNRPTQPLDGNAILELAGDFVVVNKPAGVPSQPTRKQSVVHIGKLVSDTMQKLGERRTKVILVHRLDKETSGVMILARNPRAATFFTEQFKHREVQKRYLALVHGTCRRDEFVEKASLSRLDRQGFVRVDRRGKKAETHFHRLSSVGQIHLMGCVPTTGRSHQIRVHLAHNHLPILGDKRYLTGHPEIPPPLKPIAQRRHCLHAYTLELALAPGKPAQRFVAKVDSPLEKALFDLGIKLPEASGGLF